MNLPGVTCPSGTLRDHGRRNTALARCPSLWTMSTPTDSNLKDMGLQICHGKRPTVSYHPPDPESRGPSQLLHSNSAAVQPGPAPAPSRSRTHQAHRKWGKLQAFRPSLRIFQRGTAGFRDSRSTGPSVVATSPSDGREASGRQEEGRCSCECFANDSQIRLLRLQA
jgi:hypothetical protein